MQQRFPTRWNSPCRSRCRLILGMRMWRKQPHTLDHPPRLVIVEPILTRLEARNNRMSCCRRMLGRMLARRTVAAADVPTLRTTAQMKPPTFRRGQALDTTIATRLRSGVDSAPGLFHFLVPFRDLSLQKNVKPPARSSRKRPSLPLLEPRRLH